MHENSWIVIVNPTAGSGKGLKDWPIISNQMYDKGLKFTCLFTEHKYHAIELTVKAINDGFRNIVAVGGDGTIHEVVNGIFIQKVAPTTNITLAVIPTGTGNDWIRMFGISKTYSEAVESMVVKKTVLQDVAKVDFFETRVPHVRYMANVAGLGFDAVVNLHYNRLKDEGKYGKSLYLRSTFNTFMGFRSKKFCIKADGKIFYEGMVFSGAVGIGRFNGGGMQQTPVASVNDGLMDLTIIKKMPKLRVLKNFKLLFSGNIYKIPKVIHMQAKRIEIHTIPQTRIEIDGEAVGTSPFIFELMPQMIKVVVGQSYNV
ncbi:MAG: diacylglycerol kinase family lipid kinase [Bacteroidales bacterium]|jgi:YegS/Rv2252/BmrU family lipid kinase|nr:diacylglycerol kinase family lipid kinase [Bacteroidales bacterium]